MTYPEINPYLESRRLYDSIPSAETIAHQKLSTKYRAAHEQGDAKAIFTYMKADTWVFREVWVMQQIESWRQDDTPAARQQLHKLMGAYTDTRGQNKFADTVGLIKRDQAIFRECITLQQQGVLLVECFATLASKYHHSKEGIKKIYEVYTRKEATFRNGYTTLPPRSRGRAALEAACRSKGWEQPDWEKGPRFHGPPLWKTFYTSTHRIVPPDSLPEEVLRTLFFQWLEAMATRLDALGTG